MQLIIDASVATKWFFPEENAKKAHTILKEAKNDVVHLIAADLFYYEMGNVLVNKKTDVETVEKILNALRTFITETHDVAKLSFTKIYHHATLYALSFYDASYITLMEEKQCEFITADKKLYQKIAKAFPKAKLL